MPGAFVLQQPLGDRPAPVRFAEQVVLLRHRVVEEGLAEGRGAGDQANRLHGDAGLVHGEEQEADALVFRDIGVRAHEAEDPVRELGAGRPDLLAVHEEVVALVLGAGAQARQVGPGTRFRVALAPPHLAAGDARDVALLLLLGAVLEQRRPEHGRTHAGDGRARSDAAHLLEQNEVLVLGQSAAAVLGRPGRDRVTAFGRALEPRALVVGHRRLGAAPGCLARTAATRRAVLFQPRPCLCAKAHPFSECP